MPHSFIRLRPRAQQIYVSQGRIVWSGDQHGFIGGGETGVWIHETRMLSRYRPRIAGAQLTPVALSKVEQHAWLGYYVFAPPDLETSFKDTGSGLMVAASEHTIELRISRFVGSNIHEDLDLTNFSSQRTRFELSLELAADFADLVETSRPRQQFGELRTHFEQPDEERSILRFDYATTHGDRQLERGLEITIHRADSQPRWEQDRLVFSVTLEPHETWHCCLDYLPRLEAQRSMGAENSIYQCHSFEPTDAAMDQRRLKFVEAATRIDVERDDELSSVVRGSYERAVHDLASLRLHDLDVDERTWTAAAGLPLYIAFFGRDTLTTAWQSAMVDTGLLRGTLVRLKELQGVRVDDWRDEQPGRLLHEAHTGPLEVLGYNPRERYYGSITTSAFYPVAVCQLWHWTGNKDLVRPFVRPALDALAWLDRDADVDGDGFYEYLTRSTQGTRHQAWKDSETAMVYEDGSLAEPPIATSEEQGFVYLAKFLMSELLWWLDERDLARRLRHEANELKKRFCDAFWMDDYAYLAMALDSEKRPLRSIASNAGHCLATGIIDDAMAMPIADRLMSDALFSGWGVRTLASDHPAYNPYSYHRGSVWPVENATFALGLLRYGLVDQLERLCRAQFEAVSLFDSFRFPEVFSGHERDRDHPFPAFYPQANSPQAWSSSAIFSFVQAMCGIYPYAPLDMLFVDPNLPPWLPELTLSDLRVGKACVTLRFRRRKDGKTVYRVENLRGKLHVLRQASPWSLTSGSTERLINALTSLLPGR